MLLCWLREQHLLPLLPPSSHPLRCSHEAWVVSQPSLDELMPLVCSGELLCDIAAHISSHPLPCVFRPPSSASTALANIRKASERLRASASDGIRLSEATHQSSDLRLLQGDSMAALAWLRCAHRIANWRKRRGRRRGSTCHEPTGGS